MLCVDHGETSVLFQGNEPVMLCVDYVETSVGCFKDMSQ